MIKQLRFEVIGSNHLKERIVSIATVTCNNLDRKASEFPIRNKAASFAKVVAHIQELHKSGERGIKVFITPPLPD